MNTQKMSKVERVIIGLVVAIILLGAVLAYIELPALLPKPTTSAYLTAQVICANGKVVNLSSKTRLNSLEVISETSPNIGSIVTSINTNLDLIPVFTLTAGTTISSYTVSGTFSVYINNYASGSMSTLVWDTSMAMSPVSPLPTLTSGSSSIVSSSTISLSSSPFTSTYLTSGHEYELRDCCSGVTITITFSDGSTATQMAQNAEIDWVFEYKS